MTADSTNQPAASTPGQPDPREHATETTAALGHFARKLAHDLNNFATVIRTYSELLLSELPLDGTAHADVAEVHRAADAMIAYVQRVARFSRVGGMRVAPVDLDAAIVHVVSALPSTGAAVHFNETYGAPLTAVPSDTNWFSDVLRELVQNAREASPPGGSIMIARDLRTLDRDTPLESSTVRAGSWAVVSVSDGGDGFSESVQANAEDPFVTTKEGIRAAGFGLTVAAAFVGAHRGYLTRQRLAERTVVSLWLPLPR